MHTHSELAHRVAQLERLLNLNDATLQSVFHLTEQCSNLLGLLLNCGNVPLKLDGDAHYGGLVNPRPTVQRLREQLKPFGIEVHTRRGIGYFLAEEDKARIREMLKAESPPELPLSLPIACPMCGHQLHG